MKNKSKRKSVTPVTFVDKSEDQDSDNEEDEFDSKLLGGSMSIVNELKLFPCLKTDITHLEGLIKDDEDSGVNQLKVDANKLEDLKSCSSNMLQNTALFDDKYQCKSLIYKTPNKKTQVIFSDNTRVEIPSAENLQILKYILNNNILESIADISLTKYFILKINNIINEKSSHNLLGKIKEKIKAINSNNRNPSSNKSIKFSNTHLSINKNLFTDDNDLIPNNSKNISIEYDGNLEAFYYKIIKVNNKNIFQFNNELALYKEMSNIIENKKNIVFFLQLKPTPDGASAPAPAPASASAPAPASASAPAPAPAPAPASASAPAPSPDGSPAPAPSPDGSPAPSPASASAPAPAPSPDGSPAPAPALSPDGSPAPSGGRV
jgi:hypothetical protein